MAACLASSLAEERKYSKVMAAETADKMISSEKIWNEKMELCSSLEC